ncbi:branched-chain amino acid transport system substrate-binding protein [Amaricoccus macauensis]|uniref:Branched-chain amino acid transport system substrate-binding protein n=1 Tax=Amaricoccus macauensis TaxID=57001 RepID=A0A840SS31_9RHOB|nr:ABC transporter substrate-binding protein [Amaricoccus macauensis]MBB5223570.1 branched-chain amino acid transport system substrate-binding protein [Amaricoccus macauensis]
MHVTRRTLLGTAAAAAAVSVWPFGPARAEDKTIRIGVITDMSGIYRDVSGPTTVECTKQAVEEFTAANPDIAVEVLVADHQNKPDVGLSVIRQWFDQEGVDLISNVGNSAIALGAGELLKAQDKAALITTAGSSDLTGKSCNANWVHWSWDSWALAHSTATSSVKTGGDKWFFITADYAFGHAAEQDATRFVEAAGGQVLGAVRYPYGSTTDFSSFLLQAQASGANVIGLANSGNELINALRQAQEFGIVASGVRMAALVGYITDVMGMGLDVAQGLTLTETFYWNLNDRTRAFMDRMRPRLGENVFPNMSQAGDYAGVLHYLKAVKAVGVDQAKASGGAVIAKMKEMPTDDDAFGQGTIRPDGRKLHPAYLFQVKTPEESTEPGDIYNLLATIPAEEAFRPMSEGGCPLVAG